MTVQAYLNNIQAKTGKTPADFRAWGDERGFTADGALAPGVKVMKIVNALKEEFQIGHGHANAIVALLKGAKKEGDA